MRQPIQDPVRLAFPKQRLNRSLRILINTNTTLVFVLGLFYPFYAVFVKTIDNSVLVAGLGWAVFGIVTGVLTLLFSRWGLKVKDQELLIALGYLIRTAVFLSYAFMGSLPQLICTQILWGIAAAIGSPAFDSVFSKHTTSKRAIAQWASWEGLSSIASGVAAIVGGIMIELCGFRIVFLSMAAITFVLALYIWRLPRKVL
jgi:predicted MFS family arabinose efflux permease